MINVLKQAKLKTRLIISWKLMKANEKLLFKHLAVGKGKVIASRDYSLFELLN